MISWRKLKIKTFFIYRVLFVLSGIPGGVVGSIFLIFLASILSPLLVPAPPFILDFNLLVILSVYIVIFFVTVVMGIVTSFMATRADISKILKVEFKLKREGTKLLSF